MARTDEAPRTGPVVAVVGAGPAGVAAARRLRKERNLRVLLFSPGGQAEYLAGTLPVSTADAPAARYRSALRLAGIEVVAARASALDNHTVRVDGSSFQVDAVVAAPGFELAPVPTDERTVAFWDLGGAEASAPYLTSPDLRLVEVVISSLPYRCPPAPYGLAMRLAARASRLGRRLRVRLTTPEPRPLQALGPEIGEFLLEACEHAGVEVRLGVGLDPEALQAGVLRGVDGPLEPVDLRVLIPPHRASPLLSDLAGGQPLVPVDERFSTKKPGVFVAGDAAASPFPRAADPAATSGLVAAEAALAHLGLGPPPEPRVPSPECFLDHGEGRYARIRVHYPDGPPPSGSPSVEIEGPSEAFASDFAKAHRRFQELRTDPEAMAG